MCLAGNRAQALIAGLAACACVAALVPAISQAGVIYRHGGGPAIDAGVTAIRAVSCPSGSNVIGGGLTYTGGYDAGVLSVSIPADGSDADAKADDAWAGYVDVKRDGVLVSAYAVCASGADKNRLSYIEKDGAVPIFDSTKVTAKCPSGAKVLGGGVYTNAGQLQAHILSDYPADGNDPKGVRDDAWQARIGNDSNVFTHAMTTYAICSKGPLSTKLKYRTAAKILKQGKQASAKASCPKGTHALGGGVTQSSTQYTAANIAGSAPADGPDANSTPTDAWKGTADNKLPQNLKLTASAICHG